MTISSTKKNRCGVGDNGERVRISQRFVVVGTGSGLWRTIRVLFHQRSGRKSTPPILQGSIISPTSRAPATFAPPRRIIFSESGGTQSLFLERPHQLGRLSASQTFDKLHVWKKVCDTLFNIEALGCPSASSLKIPDGESTCSLGVNALGFDLPPGWGQL